MIIGQKNSISFKVNIIGTNVEPKVRIIIGCVPELSWAASQKEDGSWFSILDIPESVNPGNFEMRVEVILRDKLFVPIKKQVSLEKSANVEISDLDIKTDVLESKKKIEQPIEIEKKDITNLLSEISSIKVTTKEPVIAEQSKLKDIRTTGLSNFANRKKYKITEPFSESETKSVKVNTTDPILENLLSRK